MPSISIICGVLLILIGIIGYGYGLMNGNASITALIPAIFGILLAIFGFVSKAKDNLRKHLMHAAALVGLLGFLIPAGRILSRLGDFKFNFAALMLISMAVVCLVFVILCVKSFIDARRSREI
jgi:hypothetical protein